MKTIQAVTPGRPSPHPAGGPLTHAYACLNIVLDSRPPGPPAGKSWGPTQEARRGPGPTRASSGGGPGARASALAPVAPCGLGEQGRPRRDVGGGLGPVRVVGPGRFGV